MTEQYTEVEIPVPYGHISAKWWGSEDLQPVLMIHGWQDNAGTFDLLVPQLLANKRSSFLCIDLPGHGFSSHLPKGNPYHLITEGVIAIRRVKRYYEWDKVFLIGHSIGAVICFVYAATFPSDVEYVISIDSIQPALIANDLVFETAASIDKFLEYDLLAEDSLPEYEYSEAVKIMMQQYGISETACDILLKRGLKQTANGKYIFSRDVRLKADEFKGLPEDMAVCYARRIKCRYLNLRVISDNNDVDNEKNYKKIFEAVKESAQETLLIKLIGAYYVHLEFPEKLANFIEEFIR